MRSMGRIRNLAFLGLLVTLIWAGSVNLSADSGGFFCGYGECTLTYSNCYGSWTYVGPPHLPNGHCGIGYEPAMQGDDDPCYISLQSSGAYYWVYETCGTGHCFLCRTD